MFMLMLVGALAASAQSTDNTAEALRLYDEVRKDIGFKKYYWFSGCGETMEQADEMALSSIPNATIHSHIGGFSLRCTPLKGDSPSAGVRLDKIRLCTNLLRHLE